MKRSVNIKKATTKLMMASCACLGLSMTALAEPVTIAVVDSVTIGDFLPDQIHPGIEVKGTYTITNTTPGSDTLDSIEVISFSAGTDSGMTPTYNVLPSGWSIASLGPDSCVINCGGNRVYPNFDFETFTIIFLVSEREPSVMSGISLGGPESNEVSIMVGAVPPPPCPGDIDGDGDTDVFDFAEFASAFGSALGDPEFNAAADLDGNELIDVFDFGIFASDFGCTL